MKRVFDEISDDEWENHRFRTSRVFKKLDCPRPPIESFAYQPGKCKPPEEQTGVCSAGRAFNLEDEEEEVAVVRPAQGGGRVRRFVVDEDSDVEVPPEVVEIRSTEEDDEDFTFGGDEPEEEDGEGEGEDLVGKALQKCGKISAALRQELYGSSVSSCERYAEVDASAARIVTQVRISFSIVG